MHRYELGCDWRGQEITSADETPAECGFMLCKDQRLSVLLVVPTRQLLHLPFGIWMSSANARPEKAVPSWPKACRIRRRWWRMRRGWRCQKGQPRANSVSCG